MIELSKLIILVGVQEDAHIVETLTSMETLAARLGLTVCGDFNHVRLVVNGGDDLNRVVRSYHEAVQGRMPKIARADLVTEATQ